MAVDRHPRALSLVDGRTGRIGEERVRWVDRKDPLCVVVTGCTKVPALVYAYHRILSSNASAHGGSSAHRGLKVAMSLRQARTGEVSQGVFVRATAPRIRTVGGHVRQATESRRDSPGHETPSGSHHPCTTARGAEAATSGHNPIASPDVGL